MSKKEINKIPIIVLVLLTVATLFMGIGYAAINAITMNIEGIAIAEAQEGVFITDVVYKENNSANVENSKINDFYQTMLNSTVVLSDTNVNSSITYTITIYNKTNEVAYFNSVVYVESAYDNADIVYTLNGLETGKALNPKESIQFDITFKYGDNVKEISNSVLNSYLNFKFKAPTTVYEIAANDYTVGTDMTAKDSKAYYDERNLDGITFRYNQDGFYLKDTSTGDNYWIHYLNLTFTNGHVYYLGCEVRVVKAGFRLGFARYEGTEGHWYEGAYVETKSTSDDYVVLSAYGTKTNDLNINSIELGSPRTATTETYVRNLVLLDLTEIFGAGNEPPQEWCDENLKYGTTEVKWYENE